MNATYSIPECNLPELQARIDKLNKRCRKLSMPEIAISKSPECVKRKFTMRTMDGQMTSVWELPEFAAEASKKWPRTATGEVMTWWEG